MNANRKITLATPVAGSYLRELSQRVKRLEFLRSDACAHRDRVRVTMLDLQIKRTVLQWCDSFVLGIDPSVR